MSTTHTIRYLPHQFLTCYHAVLALRHGEKISYICQKYKISRTLLWRGNRRFDGTKESLMDCSHRPHTPHPNAHTDEEITWIHNYIKRNPTITVNELWYNKGYTRHLYSLYRVLRRLGYRSMIKCKKKRVHNRPYHTPTRIEKK